MTFRLYPFFQIGRAFHLLCSFVCWQLILASAFSSSGSAQPSEDILHGIRIKGIRPEQNIGRTAVGDDFPTGTATDTAGNTYVVGYTEGTFAGQSSFGAEDCFLAKFNSSGVQQWAIQFGTSGSDICQGVALDVATRPNVHVTGYTDGTFSGQTKKGLLDLFVGKFTSNNGTRTWLVQLGTTQNEYAYGIACDTSNRAYVVGSTRGSLPGFSNLGNSDAYLISLNTDGTVRWYRQFGTNKDEEALAVARDSSNRFFPAGYTQGTFSGQTYAGSLDAWVARYADNGTQSWVRQFGTVGTDQAIGVNVVASLGITNIVGTTTGAFSGYTNAGGTDYFLVRRALNGNLTFVRQDGTSGDDLATVACADNTGNPTLGGRTTGSFSGFTNQGQSDVWLAEYSTTGTLSWRQQRGTTGDDTLNGLSCTTTGINNSAGSTSGVYPGQTALGAEDAVVMRYSSTGTLTFTTQFGTAN
jgi:hypothetical protein